MLLAYGFCDKIVLDLVEWLLVCFLLGLLVFGGLVDPWLAGGPMDHV